jgi:hypothetical protein
MSVLVNSYRFGAAAPGFDPGDVDDLWAWWDSSDASTLYDATSGGSLVAADGAIARWEDKSGLAHHLTQSTSGNRPTRKTAIIGGRDAALFDSANANMIPSSALTMSGGATIFLVVQRTSDGNQGVHSFNGANLENHHPFSGSYYSSFGINTRETWVQAYDSSLHLYSETAGTTWRAHKNGSQVYTASGKTLANQPSGSQLVGSGSHNFGNCGRGYYCEVIIYERTLPDADREQVEDYLMTKWDI